MLLTVFTPTYNREEKIRDLYNSLLNQTCFDFEWVVVDDGSADRTDLLVKKWIDDTDKFKISYYKQENHGKHSAINKGVELASGEAFLIVDSDDQLHPMAVKRIIKCLKSIEDMEGYCGCAGLKIYTNGDIIGQKACSDIVDCTSLQRNQYGITGDKAEVFYTHILRQYPFPVFEGENFLTEKVVWYRIASDGYKIRWVNEPLIICEYLNDGLTHMTGKNEKNYEGFKLTVREMLKYKEVPIRAKLEYIAVCGQIAIKKGCSIRRVANEVGCPAVLLFVLGMCGVMVKKVRTSSISNRRIS